MVKMLGSMTTAKAKPHELDIVRTTLLVQKMSEHLGRGGIDGKGEGKSSRFRHHTHCPDGSTEE